jgi:hypothetical protein
MARRVGGRRQAAVPGSDLLQLQLRMARLGMDWAEMTTGAAAVIARRTLMMAQPARLADPELALMVTEKMAAVGEAAERASRHALKHQRRSRSIGSNAAAAALDATVGLAASCLSPFHRRVRANVKRLGRKQR